MNNNIELVECPRDAMQGWHQFIPTEQKVSYLNQLLKVGFDVLDFGSFVSPKAIPQMADTKEVLSQLNLQDSKTKLLAIIANTKGAQDAVQFPQIDYLGFPFSISETFQQRNTNKSIAESLLQVKEIQELCHRHNKQMVIYISMGFGNPYGDDYSPALAIDWVGQLSEIGIHTFAISDTVGVSNPQNITEIFSALIPSFPNAKIGAHFHSTPQTRHEKISAAYDSGCRRFDAAINGIGGCPMANDELVGNMATESILDFMAQHQLSHPLNMEEFIKAEQMAGEIFV